MRKTFLCMPYSGAADPEAVISGIVHPSNNHDSYQFVPVKSAAGAHCYNFNRAWCKALNTRKKEGWTHFAMIHSDVEPVDNGWLDLLIDQLDSTESDLISVVLPMKDKRRLTSTAILDSEAKKIRRITMHELMSMPANFNGYMAGARMKRWEAELHKTELLVSSGLWVCDFTGDWCPEVWFEMRDRIARLPPSEEHPDGEFFPINWSEDWNFSRQCYEQGLRIFATRVVRANHKGGYNYSNQEEKEAQPWQWDMEESTAEWLDYLPGLSSNERM